MDNKCFFKIADIVLWIRGTSNLILKEGAWPQFIENNKQAQNITVNMIAYDSFNYLVKKYSLQDDYRYVFRYENEVFLANEDMNRYAILDCSDKVNFSVIMNHIFYSSVVKYHMVQFHSSLIRWQKKGIMFLGPSGIGKTTQAELWQKYQNAEIINGDLVFVQEKENGFLGWGTPWHGSSPYCMNDKVKIAAIVILKQTKNNHIRRLSGLEMVSEVAKNMFYPMWVDNGMDLAMGIMDRLLSHVPVYELSNKADEESVDILKNVIQ